MQRRKGNLAVNGRSRVKYAVWELGRAVIEQETLGSAIVKKSRPRGKFLYLWRKCQVPVVDTKDVVVEKSLV